KKKICVLKRWASVKWSMHA
ncbi:aminotransferase class-III family protein, partial [Vibrio parahaemolyticus V-223/04]